MLGVGLKVAVITRLVLLATSPILRRGATHLMNITKDTFAPLT